MKIKSKFLIITDINQNNSKQDIFLTRKIKKKIIEKKNIY